MKKYLPSSHHISRLMISFILLAFMVILTMSSCSKNYQTEAQQAEITYQGLEAQSAWSNA